MLDQAERLRMLVKEKNLEDKIPIEDQSKTKIITVTSGKGGVGKSNFVVNLGIELQKMGNKVLIFDADVGMGNDDVLMGFLPKYNVYDIIFNNRQIEDVIVEGSYGIKLLPGGTGLSKISEIDSERRKDFLEKLSHLEEFDFILMDTGAGISDNILAFVKCCEELIVITTPEPTSLTDAYSLIKAIKYYNIKFNAKIVVNRVVNTQEGEITFNKFKNTADKFLGVKLEHLGNLSEDRKVVQSVRSQKPFIINFPNCDASLDIHNIALKLCENSNDKKSQGIQGLFKKIFNIFS